MKKNQKTLISLHDGQRNFAKIQDGWTRSAHLFSSEMFFILTRLSCFLFFFPQFYCHKCTIPRYSSAAVLPPRRSTALSSSTSTTPTRSSRSTSTSTSSRWSNWNTTGHLTRIPPPRPQRSLFSSARVELQLRPLTDAVLFLCVFISASLCAFALAGRASSGRPLIGWTTLSVWISSRRYLTFDLRDLGRPG